VDDVSVTCLPGVDLVGKGVDEKTEVTAYTLAGSQFLESKSIEDGYGLVREGIAQTGIKPTGRDIRETGKVDELAIIESKA